MAEKSNFSKAVLSLRPFLPPEDPALRRRWYITQTYVAALFSTISAVVMLNMSQLEYAFRLDISIAWPIAFLSMIAGFGSLGFNLLQLFLESGDRRITFVGRDATQSVGRGQEATGAAYDPPAGASGGAAKEENAPTFVSIAKEMTLRLEQEIRAQGRKANTNLSMGIATAILAMLILAWLSLESSASLQASLTVQESASAVAPLDPTPPPEKIRADPMLYWGHFTSKIALSITANIFALFFLSTYRRNLTEIKYFQNEMTNVQSQTIALVYANSKKFSDTEKNLLIRIADVERNFILKRGETTADIQIKDMDASEMWALASVVGQLSQGISAPKAQPPKPRTPRKRLGTT